jgi:hypothetical protein
MVGMRRLFLLKRFAAIVRARNFLRSIATESTWLLVVSLSKPLSWNNSFRGIGILRTQQLQRSAEHRRPGDSIQQ